MPVKALVLDFDSTISTPQYLVRLHQWAVADKVSVFRSMTADEQCANLGGTERIAALRSLLSQLHEAGVVLHIISIGHRAAFMPHLQNAGLLNFFADQRVFGQDSHELQQVGFVKARLIHNLMTASGWSHDDVLFVDDSKEHIERASGVCKTLLVSAESKTTIGGMAEAEFNSIRSACLAPLSR